MNVRRKAEAAFGDSVEDPVTSDDADLAAHLRCLHRWKLTDALQKARLEVDGLLDPVVELDS